MNERNILFVCTLQAVLFAGISAAGAAAQSVFVGNYGEVISYPADYAAEARMHGEKEVVVFHPSLLRLDGDSIKPDDFRPLGIVELLVMPKDSAGLVEVLGDEHRKLAAYCGLKAKAIHRSDPAADVKRCGRAGCPIEGAAWPGDTCQFDTKSPSLHQIYSASKDEYFILTSGMAFGKPAPSMIARSLMRSLTVEEPRGKGK